MRKDWDGDLRRAEIAVGTSQLALSHHLLTRLPVQTDRPKAEEQIQKRRAKGEERRARSDKPMITIRDTPSGATFQVRVQPRARKDAIVGEIGEALKLAVAAPPVEGRANEACIVFLAELLNVPRSSVTIAAGQSSRNKVVRVAGLSATELHKRLRNSMDGC